MAGSLSSGIFRKAKLEERMARIQTGEQSNSMLVSRIVKEVDKNLLDDTHDTQYKITKRPCAALKKTIARAQPSK